MKVPAIKKLVETYPIPDLLAAEAALLEENSPAIEVEGKDEGEQLTHILAAIEILRYMEKNNAPFTEALRYYSQRVRTSIN